MLTSAAYPAHAVRPSDLGRGRKAWARATRYSAAGRGSGEVEEVGERVGKESLEPRDILFILDKRGCRSA